MSTQSCYVIYAKQKKSNDWMALGVKQTREEAETLARDIMSKVPFLESYRIEETAYAGGVPNSQSDSTRVQEISPKELKRRLEANDPSLQLIDVREDWELDKNQIPGALFIKLKELPHQMSHLSQDKEYIVYCAAGYRAYYACEFLQENGYRVKNLTGGMLGWKGIGFVVPILDTAMSLSNLFRKRKWEDG